MRLLPVRLILETLWSSSASPETESGLLPSKFSHTWNLSWYAGAKQ